MRMPNFLVIGAAQSGTTSLYNYLNQHPDVYMCLVKETNFFTTYDYEDTPKTFTSMDFDGYKTLFQDVSQEKAIGEASPNYLYSSGSPELIASAIPDVKLIAILRNPVDRAYSNFMFLRLNGRESLEDFGSAIKAEEERIRSGRTYSMRYVDRGYYGLQLERYFKRFRRNQIRILIFEDFVRDPVGVMKDLWQFIGVDPGFVPDVKLQHNKTGLSRSKLFHSLLNKPSLFRQKVKSCMDVLLPNNEVIHKIVSSLKNMNIKKPPLSVDQKKVLLNIYKEDIRITQDLIGQDLTRWLDLK